jgi:hypothetical protein
MNQPNPKNHLIVSLGKSAIRIAAGVFLICGMLVSAGALFIFAEALGVLEELV